MSPECTSWVYSCGELLGDEMEPFRLVPVSGAQCLHGAGAGKGWTVEDFWRWRYAILMDDDTKGAFAEWMVATLLGLPTPPGGFVNGDNCDLTAAGRKIEVKSSAYWQSWKLFDFKTGCWRKKEEIVDLARGKKLTPDSVKFAKLYARQADGGKLSERREFKADIYIFTFQNEVDPFRWDALNLEQWEFYALEREVLLKAKATRDSQYKTLPPKGFALTLPQLRQLCGRTAYEKGMSATELQGWAAQQFGTQAPAREESPLTGSI